MENWNTSTLFSPLIIISLTKAPMNTIIIKPHSTLTAKYRTISMTYNDDALIVNVAILAKNAKKTIRVVEEILVELLKRIKLLEAKGTIKDSDIIKLAYYVSAANKECDTGLMVALALVKALIEDGLDKTIELPLKKKKKEYKEIILGSDEYLDSVDLAAFATLPASVPSGTSGVKKHPKKLLLEEQQLEILERDAKLLEDMDANMLKYLGDM